MGHQVTRTGTPPTVSFTISRYCNGPIGYALASPFRLTPMISSLALRSAWLAGTKEGSYMGRIASRGRSWRKVPALGEGDRGVGEGPAVGDGAGVDDREGEGEGEAGTAPEASGVGVAGVASGSGLGALSGVAVPPAWAQAAMIKIAAIARAVRLRLTPILPKGMFNSPSTDATAASFR